jgi:hypothetical protein
MLWLHQMTMAAGFEIEKAASRVVERFPRPILRLACPSAERIYASLHQLCDLSPPSFEVRKIAVCDKSIRRLSPSGSVACLLDLVEKEKMTVSR